MPSQRLFGVLNLNKPAGVTSRDVVNIVQRLVRPNKVGHAGTLDPLATGVLLVCVGAATRLVSTLQQAPKTYLAEFQFGVRSDTDDNTGVVEDVTGATPVTKKQIQQLLPEFCGMVEQIPPSFSAIKVNGQRAYAMARKGQNVALTARPVRIDSIEIQEYHWPKLTVEIHCGSGTYIRSIARDMGERLGCGGLMTALERTGIGEFTSSDGINPNSLTAATIADAVLPAVDVVSHISHYNCTEEEQAIISRGGAFDVDRQRFSKNHLLPDRPGDQEELKKNPPVALVSECGTRLLALAETRRQGRRIQPRTVFMTVEGQEQAQ